MINDDKATFGYYMVGVFDVLGQSRKLREQTGLPLADDPAELQRVLALLTVGNVYASLCKKGAYAPFSSQRRSRALFWLHFDAL